MGYRNIRAKSEVESRRIAKEKPIPTVANVNSEWNCGSLVTLGWSSTVFAPSIFSTAYTLFVKETYPGIKAANPTFASKDIIAIVAKQWGQELSPQEKEEWKARAVATHDVGESPGAGQTIDGIDDEEAVAAAAAAAAAVEDVEEDEEVDEQDEEEVRGIQEEEAAPPARRSRRKKAWIWEWVSCSTILVNEF